MTSPGKRPRQIPEGNIIGLYSEPSTRQTPSHYTTECIECDYATEKSFLPMLEEEYGVQISALMK